MTFLLAGAIRKHFFWGGFSTINGAWYVFVFICHCVCLCLEVIADKRRRNQRPKKKINNNQQHNKRHTLLPKNKKNWINMYIEYINIKLNTFSDRIIFCNIYRERKENRI